MALIVCPECNSNVSEFAVSCPHCGYPIKKESNMCQWDQSKAFDVFAIGEDTLTFSDGLNDGAKGICEEVYKNGYTEERKYSVQNGELTLCMPAGKATYKILDDFLIIKKKPLCHIPNSTHFSASYTEFGDETIFYPNGTYSSSDGWGKYIRKGDFLVTSLNPRTYYGYLIYENQLQSVAFVRNPEKLSQLQQLKQELEEMVSPTSNPHNEYLKCPYCGSSNLSKIDALQRGISIGFWGLGSSKIGKQWHCKNCGSNF